MRASKITAVLPVLAICVLVTQVFAGQEEGVGSDIKIVVSCEKAQVKIGEPIVADVRIEYLGKNSLTFRYCFTKDDACVSDLHVVVECTERCCGYGLLDKVYQDFSKPRTIELGPNSYFGTEIQIVSETVNELLCMGKKGESTVYFVFSKDGVNIESNRIRIEMIE